MNARVLVIGGTRGTGFLIAERLLRDGYRVRVAARNRTEASQRLGAEIEFVAADITQPTTLHAAVRDTDHIIITAGVTKRPAGERLVRATEYDGVRHTLAAARQVGFSGRFLYMTSIGVNRSSLGAVVLNMVKRNTLS